MFYANRVARTPDLYHLVLEEINDPRRESPVLRDIQEGMSYDSEDLSVLLDAQTKAMIQRQMKRSKRQVKLS